MSILKEDFRNPTVPFNNLYRQGFARVAVATFPVTLGDPQVNAQAIAGLAQRAHDDHVAVLALPELCLTGYSADDLFLDGGLQEQVEAAVRWLRTQTQDLAPLIIFGAPVPFNGRVYNGAVALNRGKIQGITLKSYLPTYGEFYEARYFGTAAQALGQETLPVLRQWGGQFNIPLGAGQCYTCQELPDLVVGIEICEDMWVPQAPATGQVAAGATVIVNLSGSPVTVGRARRRELLARSASARYTCAYLYAAAGAGESSNDVAWDGQTLIYEDGELLAAGERFAPAGQYVVADVDVRGLVQRRRRLGTFTANSAETAGGGPAQSLERVRYGRWNVGEFSILGTGDELLDDLYLEDEEDEEEYEERTESEFLEALAAGEGPDSPPNLKIVPPSGRLGADDLPPVIHLPETLLDPQLVEEEGIDWDEAEIGLRREIARHPFVPDDPERLDEDCYEAYNIQVSALIQRIKSIGNPKLVIGISGGLDSTHALLVCVQAMARLGRPLSDILAYTMPGFATSEGTRNNALELCRALGVPCEVLDIRPAALQMLRDLGHGAASHPLVLAGAQAAGAPLSEAEAQIVAAASEKVSSEKAASGAGASGGSGRGSKGGAKGKRRVAGGAAGVGAEGGTGVAGTEVFDVAFENVQAGLRTDYLFRIANNRGGIVVGTGDLSELALGWCTYGVGDQMSHYAVNSGVPKTLIQYLIRWVARTQELAPGTAVVLEAILNTEISPELIPVAPGERPQSTQAAVGPYNLNDFFLARLFAGDEPERIAYLAWQAWGDTYEFVEILDWLQRFYQRFFAAQFKRTAIPNGPKVSRLGSLSPRGDWRMPSDAVARGWIEQVRALYQVRP